VATFFAHAALTLVGLRAFRAPAGQEGRLRNVAVVCACLPDLDLATLVFEVRPNELIGHRGISHSIFVAALVALIAAAIWFRSLRIGSRVWWRVALVLFGATAAHGLLDAMTTSDVGVALFAPFDDARYFFPFRLIPSCPGGVDEALGVWGLLTIANELLYVIAPVAIVVMFVRGRRADPESAEAAKKKRVPFVAAFWLVSLLGLRVALPQWFRPELPRVIVPTGTPEAGNPNDITHDDLPGGKLVTRLDEMKDLHLFDVTLAPDNSIWSSSFFPSWFGGEAGRWSDGSPRLAWRTLFGFAPPTEAEAKSWEAAAANGDAAARDRIFRLAPTEKVDLAFGQLGFPATKQGLGHSHNASPLPRYWSGRCNGVATAAMYEKEPFRVVDVIGKDGTHVRFHPNDVKSLLSVAYYEPKVEISIGKTCRDVSFDAGATCSMNPAVLVMAIVNRIGLAKQSFLVDALPTIAKQYYAVANARVHASEPRQRDGTPIDPSLAARVVSLVDVAIDMTLSSTTLRYARADVLDRSAEDGSRYQRVGLVPVVVHYTATLALDSESELIGGRWTGEPADGPDNVFIVSGGPALLEGGKLAAADQMSWPFLQELARASVDEGPEMPTIDLRTSCGGRCP
jgi:inner membrane protein